MNYTKILLMSLTLLLVMGLENVLGGKKSKSKDKKIWDFGIGFEEKAKKFQDVVKCLPEEDKKKTKVHPYVAYSISQVIEAQGYPVEDIEVTTEDGYILHVFRIPSSEKSPKDPSVKKKPVFLNHGMTGNGQQFLIQWGDRNLALLLADSGFDVFIGNFRGTVYSNEHVNKSSTDKDDTSYWDFSFDEMGRFDIPAVIKMILERTESERLYYIGHSMGTTAFFVAMSQQPELNDKILTAFLMAPSAILKNTVAYIRDMAPLMTIGKQNYMDIPHFGRKDDQNLPSMPKIDDQSEYCTAERIKLQCFGCANLYLLMMGYEDGRQANFSDVSYIASVFPDTVSSKTIFHYLQVIAENKFRQFDYTDPKDPKSKKNFEVYGGQPNKYDLSDVTAPMVIFYSLGDKFTVKKDVEKLAKKLSKDGALKESILVKDKKFTHLDFATGNYAREEVYDHIVDFMEKGTYDQTSTKDKSSNKKISDDDKFDD